MLFTKNGEPSVTLYPVTLGEPSQCKLIVAIYDGLLTTVPDIFMEW